MDEASPLRLDYGFRYRSSSDLMQQYVIMRTTVFLAFLIDGKIPELAALGRFPQTVEISPDMCVGDTLDLFTRRNCFGDHSG